MNRRRALTVIGLLPACFLAPGAHASRELAETVFRRGVEALFNWSPLTLQRDMISALTDFTPEARTDTIAAIRKSGLVERASKEGASCEGRIVGVPSVKEQLDEKGLLTWHLAAPLKIRLTKGSQLLLDQTVRASAHLVILGTPGNSVLRISRVVLAPEKEANK